MKPIPDGWVKVATYDDREGDEHTQTGPSGDYMRVLRELAKKSSRIAAYKEGGQWVAREADVKEFLAEVHRTDREAARSGRKPAAVEPMPTMGDGQMRAVILLLVRIAEALESMATQPGTFHHTPCAPLLHASTNGET